tara:strand:- start:1774 stop:2310 length:537 start_codon:yes stop_codon:yes gene_type:complete
MNIGEIIEATASQSGSFDPVAAIMAKFHPLDPRTEDQEVSRADIKYARDLFSYCDHRQYTTREITKFILRARQMQEANERGAERDYGDTDHPMYHWKKNNRRTKGSNSYDMREAQMHQAENWNSPTAPIREFISPQKATALAKAAGRKLKPTGRTHLGLRRQIIPAGNQYELITHEEG